MNRIRENSSRQISHSAHPIVHIPHVLIAALLLVVAAAAAAQETETGKSAGRRVLISLSDRKLAVLEDDEVLATFSIAIGAPESPSPSGEFRIVNRVSKPTYYKPGNVVPSGKDNPVGTRWLGLDRKGYGIHGTNAPKSIGHAASH